MLEYAERCLEMLGDAERCLEMLGYAERCLEMLANVGRGWEMLVFNASCLLICKSLFTAKISNTIINAIHFWQINATISQVNKRNIY